MNRKTSLAQLISLPVGLLLVIACSAAQPVPTPTPILPTAPQPTTGPTPTTTGQPAEFVWKITGDPNPLSSPVDVGVDAEGNLYVFDAGNSRVQKFDPNGKFFSKYLLQPVANLAITYVWLIELDGQGNIYITDHSNDRMVKLDSNGNFLAAWGSTGEGAGQFSYISGIAVDKEGNVYVSDFANNTVQKFRQPSFRP
jgi:sugar lactone lactonase YvrE